MEIYNENAYDLLNKKHLELPLEQWSKINVIQDDESSSIKLKKIQQVTI